MLLAGEELHAAQGDGVIAQRVRGAAPALLADVAQSGLLEILLGLPCLVADGVERLRAIALLAAQLAELDRRSAHRRTHGEEGLPRGLDHVRVALHGEAGTRVRGSQPGIPDLRLEDHDVVPLLVIRPARPGPRRSC
ncbi:hypothetical protein OVN20_04345 [Microcella daejeonensis]|uniref:hypothetical protein n=1 Tax=Microcella daejeonensis TaxID=2994971 RepID=UPI00226FE0F0|nr:hypothetical protein [Microcella daejeonensis]WAB84802.1 hypothetical protein OVN20_04345 [Microcella daejeonensis]